jgi:hypothetical protein
MERTEVQEEAFKFGFPEENQDGAVMPWMSSLGGGDPAHRTKESLFAEALLNVGNAATIHRSTQTDQDEMQRIVYVREQAM